MIERHGQDLPIASCRHHVAEAAWVNVPDVLRCGLSDLNADGAGGHVVRQSVPEWRPKHGRCITVTCPLF